MKDYRSLNVWKSGHWRLILEARVFEIGRAGSGSRKAFVATTKRSRVPLQATNPGEILKTRLGRMYPKTERLSGRLEAYSLSPNA